MLGPEEEAKEGIYSIVRLTAVHYQFSSSKKIDKSLKILKDERLKETKRNLKT